MNRVLITGGLGYIGSHTCVSLLESGYDVVILDNLSTGRQDVVSRIEAITGRRPILVVGDVRDSALLQQVFNRHEISAVLHFAGLKSPSESLSEPLKYYDCNVGGTLALLQAMAQWSVKTIVFSSSATVYGFPSEIPVTEECRTEVPINPYGRSKLMAEKILYDLASSNVEWRIACLRYFNPVSAHASGLIGENPEVIPGNLMPYITQVASGRQQNLTIFGGDYPTRDGTGIRDYIHVQDLAEGHVAALKYLQNSTGFEVFNLGTGVGVSVLELISTFELTTNQKISYAVGQRRAGDVAECWADPSKAEYILGWKTRRNLVDMCRDAWQWEQVGTE